jgi:hypothetical protein
MSDSLGGLGLFFTGIGVLLSLRVPQESQVEGNKHQDNADVRYQPFPESIPEEQHICTDDNSYHRQNVKRGRHVLYHFNHPLMRILANHVVVKANG